MSRPDRACFVALPVDRVADIDLSVVVPAYNEAARLPAVLASLRRYVDHDRTEVIVVDDGSGDATVAVAKDLGAWCRNLRIVEHGTNRGKGAAVRSGVMAASGELVAFVDADDATDLEALEPMCQAVQGSVGAVFGSRHAPGSVVIGSPPIRGAMGRIFNHVVKYAAGTTISDTQCGAKVFRASVARAAFAGASIDGFAFDVEILRRITALGLTVIEHPVRWQYVAGSKIQLVTPLRMVRDIIKLRLRPTPIDEPTIACRYDEQLRSVAAPIEPTRVVAVGEACSVFVPPDSRPDMSDVVHRLRELDLIDRDASPR